jgi:hypothetical protein
MVVLDGNFALDVVLERITPKYIYEYFTVCWNEQML